MITSIFSKSKPINFLIVSFITFLAFFVAIYRFNQTAFSALYALKLVGVFLCCYLSILLTDFIVNKNYLTQKSNYDILLFSLFLLVFPKVFLHIDIIISNLLVLLALRRLLSLRSQKEVIKKLFDAAFLIGLASVIYFWSILFFIIVFASLFFYSRSKIEYWFVPLLGFVAVILISVAGAIIFYDNFFLIINSYPGVSFNFSNYNSPQFIVGITLLFSFGIWSSMYYLRSLKKKKKVFRSTYKIVFIMWLVASIVLFIAPQKDGSEFLFILAPISIIIANYTETIKEKWFKELFLFIIILTPFILLML